MAALTWTVPAGRGELTVETVPWALLRSTGFPVQLVAGLATATLIAAADRVFAAEQEVEAARVHFLHECWPVAREAVRELEPRQRSLRALQSCRRRVEAGARLDERGIEILTATGLPQWASRWNTLVDAHTEHLATVRAEFDGALHQARLHTATTANSDAFRHAVFVSNPGFFHSALRTPPMAHPSWDSSAVGTDPPRALRRRLDTVHRYLRRFATKCETVSFFGPVLFSKLRPEQDQPVQVGTPAPERIVVEASAWLVEQLREQAVGQTPLRTQRAWPSPLFRQPGPEHVLERVVDGRRFTVAAAALALWQAAAASPGAHLADLLAATGTMDQSDERLARLVRALGPALTVSPWRLPATELHALTRLAGEHPTATVVELADCRDRYAQAGWPDRAPHLTAAQQASARAGGDASRNGGQHYADRELFHEDRSSPLSEQVSLGAPIVDRIRQVTEAVFPLTFLAALLAREDARDALCTALRGTSAPLAALAAREIPARTDRRDHLDSILHELTTKAVGDLAAVADRPPVVELDPHVLADALAPLWETVSLDPDDACLPSPDLMVAGPDPATATWVLSELHDDCSSIFGGLERPLHSDPDGLWADFVARVEQAVSPRTAATIVSRRRSAHVTPELPGVAIELSGLSSKDRTEVVPIAEAHVPATADAVLVDGERRLLWPGDLSSTLHRALSRPALGPISIDLGTYTPRIVVAGVVLQRARWRVRLPERADDAYGQWLALHRIRAQHRLPRHVYVRHPAEPKPLYVDFADPMAVLDLARLAPADVVVSEMLPTPEQLWWRPDDQPHCAELRLGTVLRPTASAHVDEDDDAIPHHP
ncbi:lantibiotic dehydratase [Salinispora tropica]|uniref:Lantibiotic dehydratase domain protein n=1 Tax=Salinispora tropica (strain ATCC BAA-916 / DSM 44818 / JCM 13857 / NBRC 105044 / CNB-440) TaxID=369723 RepID=A4X9C4_SALTO|nr:lantibiotic dehydratase [Salinispora tropica]ABP55491.1 Lantibiotic dehydratase domain protein [Salinispora tropica CNB-440]